MKFVLFFSLLPKEGMPPACRWQPLAAAGFRRPEASTGVGNLSTKMICESQIAITDGVKAGVRLPCGP